MQNQNTGYCLILAGGIGGRLWPVSRESKPKQFLDFFGVGRTLLQQTYDRYARFISPDRIYISTNEQYLSLVCEQLPDVPKSQILAEPIRRGTLASVAWGSLVIAAKRDAQANIIVSPADQLILNEDAFRRDIQRGLDFVSSTQSLLTLGIKPTRPETGYGYIQVGDEAEADIYRLKSFTEKPEADYAKMFYESDEFYWNVGLFLFNVQTMLKALVKQVPEYQVEMPRMLAELGKQDEMKVPEFFSALPKLNVDYGILERSDNVYVQAGHFGWADLGTWGSLHIDAPTDQSDNLLLDTRALLSNSRGNIIRMPKNHIALIDGLENFVVAEEGDVLVIYPKDTPQTLRKLKNDAQLQFGVE